MRLRFDQPPPNKENADRNIVIKDVKVSNGKLLTGINSTFSDTTTINSGTRATSVKEISRSSREPPPVTSLCPFLPDLPLLAPTLILFPLAE
jgi:hypothetical protein